MKLSLPLKFDIMKLSPTQEFTTVDSIILIDKERNAGQRKVAGKLTRGPATRGLAWSKFTCLFLVSTLMVVWFLNGCAPRGESRSTEEVLESSRARFEQALSQSPEVDQQTSLLKNIAIGLETMVEIGNSNKSAESFAFGQPVQASDMKKVRGVAGDIAAQLLTLTSRAGYTSRPSLGELANQYRVIASFGTSTVEQTALGTGELSTGAIALLAARTYSLLASEVETTGFQVAGG